MSYITWVSRMLIGTVFAFSSLIKLNDLLGFSYKLEEYFARDVLGLPFLVSYALPISFLIAIVEFAVAILVLLAYKKNWGLRSLFAMLVFFAFLTFYSAYYNKVTDCGCFGDVMHFSPWQSFTKDIVLIVIALPLWFYRKTHWSPFLKPRADAYILVSTTVAATLFGIYTLNHLPVFDFRPYKVGVDINTAMKIPEDAPKDVYEYTWMFSQGDKDIIIKNEGAYPETAGKFVNVTTKLVVEGYAPPVHDFIIEKDGKNLTDAILQIPKAIVIIASPIEKSSTTGLKKIFRQVASWKSNKYRVLILSASLPQEVEKVIAQYKLSVEHYTADEKTLKTIVRANPGLLKLSYGTIKQKVHHKDLTKLRLD